METPTSARVALPLRYRASKHFIYKTYIHRHREKVSNKTFKLYERSFNICINSSGVLIKALHFNTNVGTWKYCFKIVAFHQYMQVHWLVGFEQKCTLILNILLPVRSLYRVSFISALHTSVKTHPLRANLNFGFLDLREMS